ncbi:MAG: cytochrome c4, partial [Gammaproteobacteria bacterium]|nr:cytochrome c4 [Gammaproteobacteria bacterium]NIO62425.1 cytochrome c4 [Gammaproteobacteria bacterium]
MEDIAAYYAEQTISEGHIPASADERMVELGERIYRAGDAGKGLAACMACHGPT